MSYIPQRARPQQDGTEELGVEWRVAWRKDDPALEADAIALWRRLDVLPPDVDPTDRAKELCVLAYVGGAVAAVSTAVIRELPFLRNRFAMFRCAVAPEFRRHSLGRIISREAREAVEAWSLENPEEAVMGLATVVQSTDIQAQSRAAVWRSSGLTLVGYSENNEQIRVAWFGHARIF